MAELPALRSRAVLPQGRPGLSQGSRVLRLHPPLRVLRLDLVPRGADRRVGRDGGFSRAERWHSHDASRSAGLPSGEGPPLGDWCGYCLDEGGRLPDRQVGTGELQQQLRPGRALHRPARAHARPHHPFLPLPRRRGHPALQRAFEGLVAPGGRGGAVGLRRARDRCLVSNVPPGSKGQSQPAVLRVALHRAQHRRDACGLWTGRRDVSRVRRFDVDLGLPDKGRHRDAQ